jgi:hypothetical protein
LYFCLQEQMTIILQMYVYRYTTHHTSAQRSTTLNTHSSTVRGHTNSSVWQNSVNSIENNPVISTGFVIAHYPANMSLTFDEVANIFIEIGESSYFIGFLNYYIFMQINSFCLQPCELQFLTKSYTINWSLIFGLTLKSTCIRHSMQVSYRCGTYIYIYIYIYVCGQTDEYEACASVRSLIFVYQNTRSHVSDNRNLHMLKCMYWWRWYIYIRVH